MHLNFLITFDFLAITLISTRFMSSFIVTTVVMKSIVASLLLIGGGSAKSSTPSINANARSTPKMSIAGGLRGPRGGGVDSGNKQRALFLGDLFSDGGQFEELFACGETCTDDDVCNSVMTFDQTSVFEEACNAGCFPAIQLSTCEQYCNVDGASGGQTIVDIAVGNADFSTLVAAVTAAGLVDVISGEGPFTVFGTSGITSRLIMLLFRFRQRNS